MSLKEAEMYFKKYDGQGFHMFREEPPRYEQYKKLNVSPTLEEKWRQEIVQTIFEHMETNSGDTWWRHSRVIDVLASTKTQIEKNCAQLLLLMEKMYLLDKKQKILIIESMAGRTADQKEGGCYLVCSRTHLGEKMNDVMQKLMDFECDSEENLDEMGWEDMKGRFSEAVESYHAAYERFRNL